MFRFQFHLHRNPTAFYSVTLQIPPIASALLWGYSRLLTSVKLKKHPIPPTKRNTSSAWLWMIGAQGSQDNGLEKQSCSVRKQVDRTSFKSYVHHYLTNMLLVYTDNKPESLPRHRCHYSLDGRSHSSLEFSPHPSEWPRTCSSPPLGVLSTVGEMDEAVQGDLNSVTRTSFSMSSIRVLLCDQLEIIHTFHVCCALSIC